MNDELVGLDRWYQLWLEREWLITNGLGGFASSTALGIHTRRYHGWLFAALAPPGQRVLAFSKCEEQVCTAEGDYWLSANFYPGTVYPAGHTHLVHFSYRPFPSFLYSMAGNLIRRTILMPRGANAVCVVYELLGGDKLRLRLYPLLNFRDYHALTREGEVTFREEVVSPRLVILHCPDGTRLLLGTGAGQFSWAGTWYRRMLYPIERLRGLDYAEDHYNPGFFEAILRPGVAVPLVAQVAGPGDSAPLWGLNGEWVRLMEKARQPHEDGQNSFAARLAAAAGDFLVRRGDGMSIIAGYPWFADWGRDALISLPGIALIPGRHAEAQSVLKTFSSHIWKGLVPNRFADRSQDPEYNSIDASLWFFYAVYKYLEYTGDFRTVLDELYDPMTGILGAFRHGTVYGIGLTPEGLVKGGEPGIQLTWMDAKIDGWVVTPRTGCPVEVNALWYNALRTMASLATRKGDRELAGSILELAMHHRRSFEKWFWDPACGYLADVVAPGGQRDLSLRPNQLLAISLPFPALEGSKARAVLRKVMAKLYTPFGLRTLAPDQPGYMGRYAGNRFQRDSAYHQGTVWAWWIGPLITAIRRLDGHSPASGELCRSMLEPFQDHLERNGLGHVSELFDGDPPHKAGGCFAQAWSVAEILRAYVEDVLMSRPQWYGWEKEARK